MKRKQASALVVIVLLLSGINLWAQDEETTLYNSDGNPVAYMSVGDSGVSDNPIIYLWSGKPVAYLTTSSSGEGFSVYGFNGHHLGWFVKGVLRDHEGNGVCGLKGVVQSPKLEPLKSLKELMPLKFLRELEPLRPLFTLTWSSTPCGLFLSAGAANE